MKSKQFFFISLNLCLIICLGFRTGGEKHINDPDSIANLQSATKNGNNKSAYEMYRQAEMKSIRDCTLRGQLEFIEIVGEFKKVVIIHKIVELFSH